MFTATLVLCKCHSIQSQFKWLEMLNKGRSEKRGGGKNVDKEKEERGKENWESCRMNILVSPGEILWLKRHVGFASRLARVVNYTQCFDVNTGPTSSINQIQLFKSTRKGPHRIICRHLAVSVKTSKLYLPPWGKNWTNISLKDCSSTIPLGHSYSTIN